MIEDESRPSIERTAYIKRGWFDSQLNNLPSNLRIRYLADGQRGPDRAGGVGGSGN
jgi:hypothetical protein